MVTIKIIRSLGIIGIFTFILVLAVPATMLAQGTKAEKEVRAVLDELNQANLKGGAEAATMLDKLLADDYTQVIGNGAFFTKPETLNAWKTGQFRALAWDVSDVKIRIYGKTAVVTGVLNSKPGVGALKGQLVRSRWTRVLVKRGDNWQCVSMQYTRIEEPAKQ
jgi:hypothetical protein